MATADDSLIEIHVTFGDQASAREAARAALEARLTACVNIIAPVEALFWWEGAIVSETETLAIFKTSSNNATALATFIAETHPYETPAIIRHEAAACNRAYAAWIAAETGKTAP
ncbi:divalent-cation tolerance protein CutA [Pseudohoeflea coraliihabitans]|uniref:Divalent-cation tolerance protein CutA n=1 Tax=Pseudohoeflea coraliihabitans TaxID=2860393 RepID=A0ABS6WT17_9HYPH|nr:divalent cation tolerance protein CutA [Pseudohoeflea sp. DP4N28-3]MBW3099097.1 divalent-cation tolerance protein CutA [Pseudohoeflea sp. DP4N28-3]